MTLQPTSLSEIQDAVRHSTSLQVRGAGTKSEPPGDTVLALDKLTGVIDYSPDECVITAQAGTPLRDVVATLAAHQQYLPFDPPFVEAGATLGGTVASGVNGPGRYRYGGVRDFIIGIRLVDGEGRCIRSGGKVVKNAAGFLLHHGVVGSRGRFGVLTELTFKVFPRPEARRTIRASCGDAGAALAAARRIEQVRCDCEAIDFDAAGTLSVTVAGTRQAIEARSERIARVLGRTGLEFHSELAPAMHLHQLLATHDAAAISCVKVPGAINAWPALAPHTRAALFMCAGSVAWLLTETPDALSTALREARLAGLILRGPGAGGLVGHITENPFETRVLQVLDPRGKFSAAPHSHQ